VEDQAADELARRAQARQGPAAGVDRAGGVVDAHAAERERDPARDPEARERRALDRQRPVRLRGVMPTVPLPSFTDGSNSPGAPRR
jgi:hypothetical protein